MLLFPSLAMSSSMSWEVGNDLSALSREHLVGRKVEPGALGDHRFWSRGQGSLQGTGGRPVGGQENQEKGRHHAEWREGQEGGEAGRAHSDAPKRLWLRGQKSGSNPAPLFHVYGPRCVAKPLCASISLSVKWG